MHVRVGAFAQEQVGELGLADVEALVADAIERGAMRRVGGELLIAASGFTVLGRRDGEASVVVLEVQQVGGS
ncbi:MAG: hypothetical protein ACJ757_10615 [Gaiellaceae bacterium]